MARVLGVAAVALAVMLSPVAVETGHAQNPDGKPVCAAAKNLTVTDPLTEDQRAKVNRVRDLMRDAEDSFVARDISAQFDQATSDFDLVISFNATKQWCVDAGFYDTIRDGPPKVDADMGSKDVPDLKGGFSEDAPDAAVGRPTGRECPGGDDLGGTRVSVRNEKGTTIASTRLQKGEYLQHDERYYICRYPFRVTDIKSARFYRIRIGDTPIHEVSRRELVRDDWKIELNDFEGR